MKLSLAPRLSSCFTTNWSGLLAKASSKPLKGDVEMTHLSAVGAL
jgi:hypothetical protein